MFPIFKNCVILYLFILSCFYALSLCNKTVPEPNTDEQLLQNEIAPTLQKFRDYVNAVDEKTKTMREMEFLCLLKSLGRKAIKADKDKDELLIKQGALEYENELAEKWAWFEILREYIEYFEEENFPQPYDSDFEEKKIVWDTEMLKRKYELELFEERRYQKFKYYLENPPNESLRKLPSRLDEANISVETFSKVVAVAYGLLSTRIHSGFNRFKWGCGDVTVFFQQEDVLAAIGIFLDEMGLSKTKIQTFKNNCKKGVLRMQLKNLLLFLHIAGI